VKRVVVVVVVVVVSVEIVVVSAIVTIGRTSSGAPGRTFLFLAGRHRRVFVKQCD
jgi:hypothetical protein